MELAPNHRRLNVGRLHPANVRADQFKAQLPLDRSAAAASHLPAECRTAGGPHKGRKQKGYAMSGKTMKYAAALAACALAVAGAVAIAMPSRHGLHQLRRIRPQEQRRQIK